MKLLLLGDVHGDFGSLWYAYKKEKPDAILQVGDLAKQSFEDKNRLDVGEYPVDLPPVPFIWNLGNHENLKTYKTVGTPLGFFGVEQLNGYKVVGVGGVPGKTKPIHYNINNSLKKLSEILKTEILMSHDTCSPFMKKLKSGRTKDVGSAELAEECKRIKPKIAVSGHHHLFNLAISHNVLHLRVGKSIHGYATLEDSVVRIFADENYVSGYQTELHIPSL